MKTLKGKDHYYALLCDGCCKDNIICGVYSTRKEAEGGDGGIKQCPCKHTIKKCSVEITYSR